MNYKMKIDNPLSVSSACAQRNTQSKRKNQERCPNHCHLLRKLFIGSFALMSFEERSGFDKFKLSCVGSFCGTLLISKENYFHLSSSSLKQAKYVLIIRHLHRGLKEGQTVKI